MDKIAQVDLYSNYGSPFGAGPGFGNIISFANQAAIVIAGVIIMGMFLFGGLQIIIGAGRNDPQATGRGQKAVTYAVIGFIIVFSAYWIIRIIEIISGSNFITNTSAF